MATDLETRDNPIVWMDADESRAFFDRQTRARLNITGEEFIRRLDGGEWDAVIDDPDYRDVLILSVMADVVRQTPSREAAVAAASQAATRRGIVGPGLGARGHAGRWGEESAADEESVGDEAFADGNPIVWKTLEQDRIEFDDMARSRLNMSGEEFLRRLDAGEWDAVIDDPGYEDVLFLAMFSDVAR